MIRSNRLFALAFFAAIPCLAQQQTPFKATATCPVFGPPVALVNAPGGTVALTNNTCYWAGLPFTGQAVTRSSLVGSGFNTASGWKAQGYEVATLNNGSQYLAQWTETGSPQGSTITWTLVSGSGTLQGIQGSATFTCPSTQQGTVYVGGKPTIVPPVVVGVCTVSGTYSLPGAASKTPAAAQKK